MGLLKVQHLQKMFSAHFKNISECKFYQLRKNLTRHEFVLTSTFCIDLLKLEINFLLELSYLRKYKT